MGVIKEFLIYVIFFAMVFTGIWVAFFDQPPPKPLKNAVEEINKNSKTIYAP